MALSLDFSRPIYKRRPVITQEDIDALRGEVASLEPIDLEPLAPPPLTPDEEAGAQIDLEAQPPAGVDLMERPYTAYRGEPIVGLPDIGGAVGGAARRVPSALREIIESLGRVTAPEGAPSPEGMGYGALPQMPEPRYGGLPQQPEPEYSVGGYEPDALSQNLPPTIFEPSYAGAPPDNYGLYRPYADVPVLGGVANLIDKIPGKIDARTPGVGMDPLENILNAIPPSPMIQTVTRGAPAIAKIGAELLGQEVRDFGPGIARGAEALTRQASDVLASERGSLGLGGEAKQPWEMTQADHLQELQKGYEERPFFRVSVDTNIDPNLRGIDNYREEVKRFHKEQVAKALSEGKPVPPEVLADYPDLAGAGKAAEALPDTQMVASEARLPAKTPAETIADALPDKPNAARGETALKKTDAAGFDTTDARTALDDYRGIERPDYDDIESYRSDREDAWQAFKDTLSQSEPKGELPQVSTRLETSPPAPGTAQAATSPEIIPEAPARAAATEFATQTERDAARAEFQQRWAAQYGDRPDTAPSSTARSEAEAARAVEPPIPPVEPPRPPEPEGFPYSVSQTAQAAGFTPEGMQIPRYYPLQRNTQEMFTAMGERIAQEGDLGASMTRLADVPQWTDEEIMQAAHVLQRLNRPETAVEHQRWLEILDERGLISGRETQAWSVIGRLSPEGMMLTATRMIKQAAKTGGKKKTAAIEAQIERANTEEIARQAKAEADKIIADAQAEMAKAQKRIEQLERKPVKVNALLAELDRMFGSEAGFARLAQDTVSYEQAEAFRAQMRAIADLPEAERRAAITKLKDEIAGATKKPSEAAGKLRPLEEPDESKPGVTPQRERDFAYLTDDSVRDVQPRVASYPREAIDKAKALYKQLGREATDEEADAFLDLAADLTDREGVIALIEEQRKLVEKGRPARLFTPTDEWLEKQAVEIEKLTSPEARQAFQRLHSIERLAMARIMAALRSTGSALSPGQAEEVVASTRALRNLAREPLDVQTRALDELVNRVKSEEPLATALAERKARLDTEAAARRAARQAASDIERLTLPKAAGGIVSSVPERVALTRIVGILRKAGAYLTPEEAEAVRSAVQGFNGLPPHTLKREIDKLVDSVKDFDPVKRRLAQLADEAAQRKRELAEIRDLQLWTQNIIPEAKVRAANKERQVKNNLTQTTAKNGLALPSPMAQAFMDRANAIGALPPGFQQDRLYAEFMQDVANLVPPSRWDKIQDLYSLPISLKTAWDAGYMFRQGALLGARHPDVWLDTWGPLLKSFYDPVYARQAQDQLATRPLANLATALGLAFDEIWQPNEFFSSQLAAKLKGLQGSQRSFVVPGNKIRHESFDHVIKSWLPPGYDLTANPINSIEDFVRVTGKTEQDGRDLALLYNAVSGKSNFEWLKKQRGFLRLPFFAAGWALSIPEAFGRTAFSPGARKEGARILATYFGAVAGIELMGDVAGIWDAELDPRSSNFGKIRWKGTHQYQDPTLGMAMWLRTIAQIAPTPGPQGWGQYHKTAAGNLRPQPWQDTLLDHFLRGKVHPGPGEFWSWAEGKNIVGEKRRFTGLDAETALSVLNTAKSLFAPLTPNDVVEGFLDDGATGALISFSNIVGLSTQSYTTFQDAQQKVTAGMFPGKRYAELDRGKQRQINDSAEIKLAIEQMEEPQIDLREKVADRFSESDRQMKVLETGTEATATKPAEPGLRDYIEAGMKGEALRKKIQEHKANKYRIAKALLTEDVLAYATQDKTLPMHDVWAQLWLNVPLEEDLTTGVKNFKKQDEERADILEKAQESLKAAGRTSDYITKRGEGTFRGKQAKDPVVLAALEEYEQDQETLKPYWELGDNLQALSPAWAAAVRQRNALPAGSRERDDFEYGNRAWGQYDLALERQQRDMRRNKPEIDGLLNKWYPERYNPIPKPRQGSIPSQQVPSQRIPSQRVPSQKVPSQRVP